MISSHSLLPLIDIQFYLSPCVFQNLLNRGDGGTLAFSDHFIDLFIRQFKWACF